MRIKLNENLPARLKETLAQFGHQVDTIPEEALGGADDAAVWEAAQAEEAFFITQDLDFSDVRQFAPGSHSGLLLVRLTVPSRKALIDSVEQLFTREAVDEWVGCFVVATGLKVRVRRPN